VSREHPVGQGTVRGQLTGRCCGIGVLPMSAHLGSVRRCFRGGAAAVQSSPSASCLANSSCTQNKLFLQLSPCSEAACFFVCLNVR
jgi:hypothetical protein